jgi:hypothetical protein
VTRDRGKLASALLESLDPPGDNLDEKGWAAAWGPELRRRVSELETGAVEPVPVEQALAEMCGAIERARKS